MSHSQFHCTGRVYLDLHGLIFETSICYWQDQPGNKALRGGVGKGNNRSALESYTRVSFREARRARGGVAPPTVPVAAAPDRPLIGRRCGGLSRPSGDIIYRDGWDDRWIAAVRRKSAFHGGREECGWRS